MSRPLQQARMAIVEAVAGALNVAHSLASVVGDDPLVASLERVDALLFHEARSFLKLPYRQARRGARRKK